MHHGGISLKHFSQEKIKEHVKNHFQYPVRQIIFVGKEENISFTSNSWAFKKFYKDDYHKLILSKAVR